jgi:hypothetical protein
LVGLPARLPSEWKVGVAPTNLGNQFINYFACYQTITCLLYCDCQALVV